MLQTNVLMFHTPLLAWASAKLQDSEEKTRGGPENPILFLRSFGMFWNLLHFKFRNLLALIGDWSLLVSNNLLNGECRSTNQTHCLARVILLIKWVDTWGRAKPRHLGLAQWRPCPGRFSTWTLQITLPRFVYMAPNEVSIETMCICLGRATSYRWRCLASTAVEDVPCGPVHDMSPAGLHICTGMQLVHQTLVHGYWKIAIPLTFREALSMIDYPKLKSWGPRCMFAK